jgi:hypothetical protein
MVDISEIFNEAKMVDISEIFDEDDLNPDFSLLELINDDDEPNNNSDYLDKSVFADKILLDGNHFVVASTGSGKTTALVNALLTTQSYKKIVYITPNINLVKQLESDNNSSRFGFYYENKTIPSSIPKISFLTYDKYINNINKFSPDLLIIDECHTVTLDYREIVMIGIFDMIKNPKCQTILITATPKSINKYIDPNIYKITDLTKKQDHPVFIEGYTVLPQVQDFIFKTLNDNPNIKMSIFYDNKDALAKLKIELDKLNIKNIVFSSDTTIDPDDFDLDKNNIRVVLYTSIIGCGMSLKTTSEDNVSINIISHRKHFDALKQAEHRLRANRTTYFFIKHSPRSKVEQKTIISYNSVQDLCIDLNITPFDFELIKSFYYQNIANIINAKKRYARNVIQSWYDMLSDYTKYNTLHYTKYIEMCHNGLQCYFSNISYSNVLLNDCTNIFKNTNDDIIEMKKTCKTDVLKNKMMSENNHLYESYMSYRRTLINKINRIDNKLFKKNEMKKMGIQEDTLRAIATYMICDDGFADNVWVNTFDRFVLNTKMVVKNHCPTYASPICSDRDPQNYYGLSLFKIINKVYDQKAPKLVREKINGLLKSLIKKTFVFKNKNGVEVAYKLKSVDQPDGKYAKYTNIARNLLLDDQLLTDIAFEILCDKM